MATVAGGDAHRSALYQYFHSYGFSKITANVVDSQTDPSHCAIGGRDVTQHPAMGTLKNTIQNLTFVVGGKARDVLGPVHKAQ